MSEHLLRGAELIQALNDVYQDNVPGLLEPFNPNDSTPIVTLQRARRSAFQIVAQSMLEPHLTELDFSLRAYMILRDRGVENPWQTVTSLAITPQSITDFKTDTHSFHVRFGIPNVQKKVIDEASPIILGQVLTTMRTNTLYQLLRGDEGVAMTETGMGLVKATDAPSPDTIAEMNAEIERLLREQPGSAEKLQQLFQAANRQVIEKAKPDRDRFTLQLIGLARGQRTERTQARLGFQSDFASSVNTVLTNFATDNPQLSPYQRSLFPRLARTIRIHPPSEPVLQRRR